MEKGFGARPGVRYETKFCPRCGAELYADMNVCYGCLYDFSRDGSRVRDAGLPAVAGGASGGDALDLLACGPHEDGFTDEVGMFVRTSSVDFWMCVPEKGLSLGRAPENDIVLHSPAISSRHLHVAPTPDGMELRDLGATNPARYHGREVRGLVVVPYGDVADVCGCILTMTGPAASVGAAARLRALPEVSPEPSAV